MANGYGRSVTGQTGGATLQSAYDFSPKSAQSYLTGELAQQYASDVSTLGASTPMGSDFKKKKKFKKAAKKSLLGKAEAAESLSKLRSIAESKAIGDFQSTAQSSGRGYMLQAPQGLIQANTFDAGTALTPEDLGKGFSKKVSKKLGTSKEGLPGVLQHLSSPEFGSAPLRYGNIPGHAATQLAQQFQQPVDPLSRAPVTTTGLTGRKVTRSPSWMYDKNVRTFGNPNTPEARYYLGLGHSATGGQP